ncbi:MAG: dephospho-CoA kinase [Chloroflexota bacterium]
MSKWPEKYIIGLTGNIATGKSVVRKMLEHLGAYGIDADALGHRAIAKGAPGYQPILDILGHWILDGNGQIDRTKLGRFVFTNPEELERLETIVHPLVDQAVDLLIRRASQRIIVVEAIKLLESNLASDCDTVWTTCSHESLQKARLMAKRGMNEAEALQRIRMQPPQDQKMASATVIIQNTGTFEGTWKQVVAAWKVISPISDTNPVIMKKAAVGELSVRRGRPRDSGAIANLITRLSGGARSQTSQEIMAAFGEKAYLLLKSGNQFVGLIGWQVENLVARTTEIYIDASIPMKQAVKVLATEVERASQELQCEASLLFLPPQMASQEAVWRELGYEGRTPQSLSVQAWKDAANESMPANTIMLFKQLRKDRVLRPI